jgi:hypothetical protein
MKISSLIIGKGSGSAGNITVVQLKGQTVLKQKASSVANPKTEGQTLQRNMMNRAVYAWQLLQNGIKQGWTSLLPFSSQYNTYVSTNAEFFKDATFTKSSMTARDLEGSLASKGSLGVLQVVLLQDAGATISAQFNKASLNSIAKVGDKIVIMSAARNLSEINYNEVIVTDALMASENPTIEFTDVDIINEGNGVIAIFVVSADKKNSSTSTFAFKMLS